jgi:diguanylate cyclase
LNFLTVENASIIKALQEGGTTENAISLNDLIDLYAQILLNQSDTLSDTELQKLICKKITLYCDSTKEAQESSKIITGVKESTDTILTAIKGNNTQGIELAYKELENYQQRIQKLEKEIFTDELTTLFNRRYLLSKKLHDSKSFKTNGTMYLLNVEEFKALNNRYGYSVGDNVLKYLALHLKKIAGTKHSEVIRFSGAVFILFINTAHIASVGKKLQEFQEALRNHKFKTARQEIICFNFVLGHYDYTVGEAFESVLQQTMNRLS